MLVLLLVLWVPGAHLQAQAAPAPAAAAGTTEHDVPDAALRPPARAAHRAGVPGLRTPRSGPGHAPARPAARTCAGPPGVPYAPSPPRTVVLRC
ncbi:hypothetical protein GCM10010503_31300 [Streptomyces lucensis JCM 4490]|uniref:Secreted protein n=1 Tax=Streptomyces lucensis JCM 4490 TaxID=1306176 RepID=A0A918MRH2_9ACTN|nr:hypothetical protein GCM10010503_31300 [Streptomyces lucensis JCM 4490]